MEFRGVGGYCVIYLGYEIAIKRGGVILINVRKMGAGRFCCITSEYLSVSGVSSGKRFVAEVGFKVFRRKSIATALGLGVSGVRPVVISGWWWRHSSNQALTMRPPLKVRPLVS